MHCLLREMTFHHSPWPSLLAPWVRAGIARRVFDLDHVGAHVAEQHRGDRCGVDGTDVEHPDAVQRAAVVVGWWS